MLQLVGCSLPLSSDYGLDRTAGYVSDETLEKIRQEGLTPLQVKSLLGEPTSMAADGKAMGYLQCAAWPIRCVDVAMAVPVGVGRCLWKECRQVGIWFDATDHAVDTKTFNWDERLKDYSLELWLSNHGREDDYSRTGDWTLEDESAGPAAGNFASVAPGDSWAGVFSIQQGDEVFFGRLGDSYVDWHRLLRLDPGTYTVGYYVNHHGLLYRWDQLQLHAGHRYQVGWRSCPSWTPERGCASVPSGRATTATFVWFEDVTNGQVLGGSRTTPEFTEP
jgi:hypothetical protein